MRYKLKQALNENSKLFLPKLKVYLAGKMSDSNPINFLDNLRVGIQETARLIRAGCAVFSPFIDFQVFLSLKDGEKITLEDIQTHSLAWLVVSDCLVVLDGWENSKGTIKEIEVARNYGIPIYYGINNFLKGGLNGV